MSFRKVTNGIGVSRENIDLADQMTGEVIRGKLNLYFFSKFVY